MKQMLPHVISNTCHFQGWLSGSQHIAALLCVLRPTYQGVQLYEQLVLQLCSCMYHP